MYWTANNLFSIAQTLVIQKTGLKKWLGIPDAPVNAPPLKIRSPLESISEVSFIIQCVLGPLQRLILSMSATGCTHGERREKSENERS
jgi:membrane protein insertase Oxa1/YidC/SpoIIIJ